jgi:cupin superfamily acireductone dioxygenase involved in methionine salvage
MPILRDEFGAVYTSLSTINPLIAPSEVGVFEISPAAKKLAEKPLDAAGIVEIYKHIPPDIDSYFRHRKLAPTVAITYWSGCNEKVHERVKKSLSPHTNSAGNNEVHFIFAGALIIYIDNGHGQYAVLLQPGDWIYIDGQSEAWPKLTHEKYFTLASYHSAPLSPIDEFHKQLKFTNTQEKSIL